MQTIAVSRKGVHSRVDAISATKSFMSFLTSRRIRLQNSAVSVTGSSGGAGVISGHSGGVCKAIAQERLGRRNPICALSQPSAPSGG